jgi:hypothetical protein
MITNHNTSAHLLRRGEESSIDIHQNLALRRWNPFGNIERLKYPESRKKKYPEFGSMDSESEQGASTCTSDQLMDGVDWLKKIRR